MDLIETNSERAQYPAIWGLLFEFLAWTGLDSDNALVINIPLKLSKESLLNVIFKILAPKVLSMSPNQVS
jgi:hypothetical protein